MVCPPIRLLYDYPGLFEGNDITLFEIGAWTIWYIEEKLKQIGVGEELDGQPFELFYHIEVMLNEE